ncbi:MAG: methyltransferase [Candidatus Eisenbacteria bacterium]
MTLPTVEGFARLADPVITAMREALVRGGFHPEVIDRIDGIAEGAAGHVRLPLVRGRLHRSSETSMRLALLLTFGGALARREVEGWFGPEPVAALLEAGIFAQQGTQVRCPFRVVPFESLWVLADDILDQPDSVMPPGPTTQLIVRIMPERCAGSVLDFGCGPGGMALVAAARGAERAVGTDINARAITMAVFNARLNWLPAEFRTGDGFEPVEGERFDLIVAQPPFIMLPDDVDEIRFLHGGPRGDAVLLKLLRGTAAALTPRGEALVLSDIALREDEEVGRYLSDKLGATGLDVLVLHLAGLPPETHALVYALHGSIDAGPEYVKEVQKYFAHLERQSIRSFRHALIVARRAAPDARELTLTPLPVREILALTPAVRERLHAGVSGSRLPDAGLLDRRVRVAPHAEWLSIRNAPEGDQREHRVRFGAGWPALEQIVTDEGLMLASLLERSSNVAEAIDRYAEICEATPAEVRAPLLSYIRQSLLGGMLVVEENGHGS